MYHKLRQFHGPFTQFKMSSVRKRLINVDFISGPVGICTLLGVGAPRKAKTS